MPCLFHAEAFSSKNAVNLYRDTISCRAAGDVSDNVVLYRDFPKDSSPKEPYVLHEGEVRGCVADEFDSHEGLALLLSS